MTRLPRRAMLERCINSGLLIAGSAMSQTQLLAFYEEGERHPTPQEVLGPFYRKGAPDQKNLRRPGDPGFPLSVVGRVINTKGQLIEGARVELWHADHHGRYDTQGYAYRAKLAPDAKGTYAVDTVLPGHYADRPAQHIHYLITAPGHKTLITQAYFATDPFFEGDPAKKWNKQGIVGNRELILPVKLFEGQGNSQPRTEVAFDLVLEKA